jgi:PKD domain
MGSREIVALVAVVSLALLAFAAPARALILPAVTIDGPSEDIVGFGGVAMAEDGTGGLVYLKRVDGVAHVFVSRYSEGHWSAPMRVDGENQFAASSPRIGAANRGELLVVWATPFATENEKPVQELLSSTLAPGSQAFGPAVIVDPDIREGTGTSPALAMSSTGQADVVYRVVQPQSSIPLLRPGDVQEAVRVARYGGERWTRLGAVNRDPALSMRPPTAANAPQIAITPTGTAVVVWQEPEINRVARIWARRLFGASVNYVMPVSAESFGPAPIPEDADAPAVAMSPLGQADVVYRQQAGRSSPLPGPRIFLNILSDGEATSGAEFEGAAVADSAVAGGKTASIGRPSIDVNERQSVRILYDDNGVPRVVTGTDLGLSGTLNLGAPFAGSSLAPAAELPAASVMNPEGGGVSAWPSADLRGNPAVGVREDYPAGGVQTGLVGGGAGGPIDELAVGRSGLGDGLVAFQQGPIGAAAIVAATITATPIKFVVEAPRGWIRPAQARISWEAASSANGPLTYAVVLDRAQLPTPAGVRSLAIKRSELSSGTHQLQLLVTDRYGQQTLTAPSRLKVDGRAPSVKLRSLGARRLRVTLADSGSGLVASSVTVSFGDGAQAGHHADLSHRYGRPGTYRVVVHARDILGNAVALSRRVRVR